MKDQISSNLLASYIDYSNKVIEEPVINYADKVSPQDLPNIFSNLTFNGKASCLDSFTKIEKKIYNVVTDAIKHRTPNDKELEKFSFNVSSVKLLLDKAKSFKIGEAYTPIIFRGKKGAGKTTSLNLFTKKCNDTFIENNILVVRGNAEEYQDIKKINILLDPNDENGSMSISIYMKLRATFLLIKHIDQTPFKEMYEKIYFKKCSIQNKPFVRQNGTEGCIQNIIDYISDQWTKYKHNGEGDGLASEVYWMIKNTLEVRAKGDTSRELSDWLTLADTVRDYCRKSGVKIVNVVDGIDNIYSFNDTAKIAYNSMVDDVANYFNWAKGRNIFVYYLIACRPETAVAIRQKINNGIPECPFDLVEHSPNESEKIVEKKEKLIIESLNRIRKNPEFINDEKGQVLINSFLDFNSYNLHAKKLVRESRLTSIMDLFADNVRSYLYNYITYVITYIDFVRMHGFDLKNSRPSTSTEYSLFLKNLFSGGRRLIDSSNMFHHGQSKYAVVLPNPFSYDFPIQSSLKDHILATIRILQSFEEKNLVLIPDEIIHSVSSTYGYDNNIISTIFERLIQFRVVEHEDDEENNDLHYSLVRTTNTKNVLFHILCTHPDVIMWLAFDSTTSKKVWHNISKDLISFNVTKNYISLVSTISTRFISYINNISKYELDTEICAYSNHADELAALLFGALNNKQINSLQLAKIVANISND